MRIGILSDIHANLPALEAVAADLALRGGADALWCLGDTVGYGPDPAPCLEWVRSRTTICLGGNHDLAVGGRIGLESFNPTAAAAARWTQGVLSQQHREYVAELPPLAVAGLVTLAHGTPRDPIWEYLVSTEVAAANATTLSTPFCFVGHSHLPIAFVQPGPGARLAWRWLEDGVPLALSDGITLANPGSVGQPRDGDPRAAYAIYDEETRAVTVRRVAYPIGETQERMRRAGLPPSLISRLAVGR